MMATGDFMLWELDSRDLAEEIRTAIRRYEQIHRLPATLVKVRPPADGHEIAALVEVKIQYDTTIQPGTMHVGRT